MSVRYLRHNKRSACPRRWVVVSTITSPKPVQSEPLSTVGTFAAGCAIRFDVIDGRARRCQVLPFRHVGAFWDWLYAGLTPKHPTRLMVHTARHHLPALGLWREVEASRIRPRHAARDAPGMSAPGQADVLPGALWCLDDPPIILDSLGPCGSRLCIVDALNYFPYPFSELREWVGGPKPHPLGDTSDNEAIQLAALLDAHVVRDVAVRLCNIVRDHDLGNLRHTVGGQSMALYRHRCMVEPITVAYPTAAKELEREACFGGRCRLFFKGVVASKGIAAYESAKLHGREIAFRDDGPVYKLDVNAAYPSVMAGRYYPVAWEGMAESVSVDMLRSLLRSGEAVARVALRCAREPFPVRDGHRPRWAVGTFTTVLCGPDLRRALDNEYVTAVHETVWYKRGSPFNRFVRAVTAGRLEARQAGDKILERFWKQLGNALHGKFGQRSGGWVTVSGVEPPEDWGDFADIDLDSGEVRSYRSLGGVVQQLLPRHERDGTMPAIAAYVTAYARALVDNAIWTVGRANVLYEDADSLHVTHAGYLRMVGAGMIDDTARGKWKIVEKADAAEYVGPKYYRLDKVWTISGVSPDAYWTDSGAGYQTWNYKLASQVGKHRHDGPVSREAPVPQIIPCIDWTVTHDGEVHPPCLPEL